MNVCSRQHCSSLACTQQLVRYRNYSTQQGMETNLNPSQTHGKLLTMLPTTTEEQPHTPLPQLNKKTISFFSVFVFKFAKDNNFFARELPQASQPPQHHFLQTGDNICFLILCSARTFCSSSSCSVSVEVCDSISRASSNISSIT